MFVFCMARGKVVVGVGKMLIANTKGVKVIGVITSCLGGDEATLVGAGGIL